MAEIIRHPAGDSQGESDLDKISPIRPIYEAMFWADPAELTTFCEATREAMEYITKGRHWHYMADAGSLASLIGAIYLRRKRTR